MKRNILLLTAVVLAAVMLTGCIGPFAKVKVDYVFETVGKDADAIKAADFFDQTKLVKKVKRNSVVDFELALVAGKIDTDQKFTATIKEGKAEATALTLEEVKPTEGANKDKLTGYKFSRTVLKDDLKITITPVAATPEP